MEIIKAEIISSLSISDIILCSDMPRWRKWLLRRLMPQRFYEMPAVKLAELQKGAVIGHVEMHITQVL